MESFKPEKPPAEQKKSAVWKKFEKYGKILALSALVALATADSALSQEKQEGEKESTKIEQLKNKAAEHVKKVVAFIKEKGQDGKMGETPIKRLESADKDDVTTVGYGEDGNEPTWMTHETDGGTYRYVDDGADGSLDRIIINKEEPKLGAKQKAGFNDLKTFSSMQDLADEAEVTADLNPEKVTVYKFERNGEQHFIKIVDFEEGEASELSGSDADKLTEKAQALYEKKTDELSEKME